MEQTPERVATEVSLRAAKKEKLFYVVATAVIVRSSDQRALILKRSGREVAHPGRWGVVGGKLEWSVFRENPPTRVNGNVLDWEHGIEDLLAREAQEEAGVSIDTSDLRYLDSVAFLRPDGVPTACVKFAVRATSDDVRINPEDFDGFAWVNESEIDRYPCIDGIPSEVRRGIRLLCP